MPRGEIRRSALRGMLTAGGFTSSHDFSFGGRAVDYGWAPQSLADYQDWYGGALEVATRLALSDSPLRAPVRQALAENFRALWCFGHVFDHLEAAVLAVGTQEHWPQGWLEVRETIGLDAERMEAGLLVRLRELKERLAPVGLRERLRVYVLTPAYQIAQLGHWEAPEADDGYEQAEQAVIDEALRLGREVGQAPNLLDGIWPELFGRDAHQAFRFGEGLAETVVNLPQTWRELLGHYGATEDAHRNPSLLGGFVRAAASRDRPFIEGLLDGAVTDPLLAPVFPLLQAAVAVDEAGVRRLTASIASCLAPARAYCDLGLGPATESIPPIDLARNILGIAGLPDGYKIAVDILVTHLGPRKAPPADWDPSLLDCGRELLRTYPADQINQSAGYVLAKIARVCLRGLGAAPDAGLVCRWIADASSARPSFWSQLKNLIETLLTLHPHVALDCWLGDAKSSSHALMWRMIRNEDRNPFGKVPTQILLEWAMRDPATRLPRLADVIPVLDTKADPLAWSEAVQALLSAASDRATLLKHLAGRLSPSGWVGSLADILERRRPLLQQFFGDQDPALRHAAREIDSQLQRDIAVEAAREVTRDERFE